MLSESSFLRSAPWLEFTYTDVSEVSSSWKMGYHL